MPPLIGPIKEPKEGTSPRPRSQICAYIGNWLPNRFRVAPKHVFFGRSQKIKSCLCIWDEVDDDNAIENSGSVCRSYRAGCLKNLLTIYNTYLLYTIGGVCASECACGVISNSCECKWHTQISWSWKIRRTKTWTLSCVGWWRDLRGFHTESGTKTALVFDIISAKCDSGLQRFLIFQDFGSGTGLL